MRLNSNSIIGGLLLIFVIFAATYVTLSIVGGKRASKKIFSQIRPITHRIPPEDSLLFPKNQWKNVTANKINNREGHTSCDLLNYDSNLLIFIYKIKLVHKTKQSVLKINNDDEERTVGVTYQTLWCNNLCNFYIDPLPSLPVSDIFLSIAGQRMQSIILNDSIYSCHVNCKNVSIRYSSDGPIDLYFAGNEIADWATLPIDMDILFLTRANEVYGFFLMNRFAQTPVEPRLLYQIVTGKS